MDIIDFSSLREADCAPVGRNRGRNAIVELRIGMLMRVPEEHTHYSCSDVLPVAIPVHGQDPVDFRASAQLSACLGRLTAVRSSLLPTQREDFLSYTGRQLTAKAGTSCCWIRIGATHSGWADSIRAVTLSSGKERIVSPLPSVVRLHEIAGNGHVLLSHESWHRQLMGTCPPLFDTPEQSA
jgi:hypothetical protein